MSQPVIFGSVLAYTGLLFAIAYWADRRATGNALTNRSAIIYGLSIAVYCTSWTFYGAVGTAESRGWEYLPIYLGPALVFSFGLPVLTRIVETGKRINSTSIADFLSAHYDRSRTLAGLVTLIAVIGAFPYIALQLKSVATSFSYLSENAGAANGNAGGIFMVAIILAAFAIMFGTRHIDVTRHNQGMIAAVAFDSIVKLAALLAVGVFAVTLTQGVDAPEFGAAYPLFAAPVEMDRFITLTMLSMAAILCLPRQFHVTVVECQDTKALRPASAFFLIYLALITALVIPIARAGVAAPELAGITPDLFVLALPLASNLDLLALFVFVGGFAAATAMVIVASVALSTMITNDLIAPFLLRGEHKRESRSDFGARLLLVRRASIGVLLLVAALFAAYAPQGERLANFGILSFAAVAQFVPALLGALYWKRARRIGALAGMAAGFLLWFCCLLIPSYFGADAPESFAAVLAALDFTGWDALTKGVALSLGVNVSLFCGLSAVISNQRRESAKERDETGAGAKRSIVDSGDLYTLIERCLGDAQGREVTTKFERSRGLNYEPDRIADPALVAFADQQISKAIGASSARILLRSALAGGALEIGDVATLLGETTGKVSFSQELLQTTLENISHGVSVVDTDLKLVAWNSAYVDMYNYPAGFIHEGRPVEDLIRHNAERGECGPGDIRGHIERRLEHLRSGGRHSFERMRPNGTVVKIEGMRSPSGAYVTTFTDVSDYKRIQKALSDSERSIRFYTDNIPSMVAFSDSAERVQFANNAYRTAFGLSEGDVGAVCLKDVMPAAEYNVRKPYIERALAGEKTSFDIEMSNDGVRQYMQVVYVPQFRSDGSVRGFFGLYQDVTARRRAEDALAETNETLEERVDERTRALSVLNAELDAARRQAEDATASKTRFLAAASHDVLQPLNAARLFASALKEELAGNDDAAALTEKLDASITSADRLLRSLLNISKLDADGIKPDFSEFPLADLFKELANDFAVAAEEKGVSYTHAPTSLWIRSDRGLLLSALQNIVANAIRYTDAGKVLIGARRQGAAVRIEVLDTGRGIPAARQQEIFQEFKRLERDSDVGGAGLGLATVERIAKLLSIDLQLKSTEGKGSTFSLDVPRAAPISDAVGLKTAPAETSAAPLSAICIDNDAQVLDAMKAALQKWGVDVLAFKSDDDIVEACAGAPPEPDLLLLDYQLDNGLTGFDALRRLETLWGGRPFTVLITASASGEADRRAAELGIPVLTKPVEPAELRALISRLRRRAAE